VKGADAAVLAADDYGRGLPDRQVLDEIIPRVRDLLLPAHVKPHAAEDPLPFQLEILR